MIATTGKGIIAIIASESLKRKGFNFSGTGFLVTGGALVTCAHVLEASRREGENEEIVFFHFENDRTEYRARIIVESYSF